MGYGGYRRKRYGRRARRSFRRGRRGFRRRRGVFRRQVTGQSSIRSRRRQAQPTRNIRLHYFPGTLFPEKLKIILPYKDRRTYGSSAVTHHGYYNGNGPCEPTTGITDAAYGFAALRYHYGKYRCLSSSIRLTCWPVVASGSIPICYMLVADNDSDLALVDQQYNREQAVIKVRSSLRDKPVVIKGFASTRKMLPYGVHPNPNVWASTSGTTHPTQRWYWHFKTYGVDAATSFDMHWILQINYVCVFGERLENVLIDSETHGSPAPDTPE